MKKFLTNNKLFVQALGLALIVRLFLQLVAGLAIKFVPFKGSFPYWDLFLQPKGPDWLWLWGNFDGVHYLSIAQEGYLYGLTQVFFPLYPNLIKFLSLLTHNHLLSGLIISHLSLIGFIYYFIKLGRLDYSVKTLRWSLLLLLLFPASFFFFSVYTESLFLFLVALCLYSARTRRFIPAAIIAGLASATRLVGIFLLPLILWEYYQVNKKNHLLALFKISFLSASGLLLYLAYLQHRFHNFLIFVTAQPGFGSGRQVDTFVMIYQVIFRYLKMFFGVSPQNEIYPVLVFEFLISLIFLVLIISALLKKFRTSYLLFLIPAYLLPTLTGSFASMPRYVLTAFPLFYFVAATKSKLVKILWLIASVLLLSWAFIRFSRGYWIS
ncbi:MAG: mannosyltransferase family protein [Candidatus Beckwithbacteria bacterium]|nr:mannosyltransferase family protein [Candidatus Beckwithbacteria bacterium]